MQLFEPKNRVSSVMMQSFTYTCLFTLPLSPTSSIIHHHLKVSRMRFSSASSALIRSFKTPQTSSKLFGIPQSRGQITGGIRNMSIGMLFILLSLPPPLRRSPQNSHQETLLLMRILVFRLNAGRRDIQLLLISFSPPRSRH